MRETGIERRRPSRLKERTQYVGAFALIGVMLWTVGFPLFLLFFVAVLSLFVWKVFASDSRGGTRHIFEFYLSAHEILRDDERRWFGFEIEDAINHGENVKRSMTIAPPLVHFGLGALYHKLGDHASAVKNLSYSLESETADETSVVIASRELRDYARMLRRIESVPTEAPLTTAAILSLERARKHRGPTLLAESRDIIENGSDGFSTVDNREPRLQFLDHTRSEQFFDEVGAIKVKDRKPAHAFSPTSSPAKTDENGERQTISEVLHEIYDKNIS